VSITSVPGTTERSTIETVEALNSAIASSFVQLHNLLPLIDTIWSPTSTSAPGRADLAARPSGATDATTADVPPEGGLPMVTLGRTHARTHDARTHARTRREMEGSWVDEVSEH
jgi:hypothetical protein